MNIIYLALGVDCFGAMTTEQRCFHKPCPIWSDWSEFKPCSQTCGSGQTSRSRWCKNGSSMSECGSNSNETESCNTTPCPNWGTWGQFSACSASCGAGNQERLRECVGGIAGEDCVGNVKHLAFCNMHKCPIWSEWKNSTECSKSCGTGSRMKSRTCLNSEDETKCAGSGRYTIFV